jgi:hypothetical protein
MFVGGVILVRGHPGELPNDLGGSHGGERRLGIEVSKGIMQDWDVSRTHI